jgi:hypothetical protein
MIAFKEPKVKVEKPNLGSKPRGIALSWMQWKPQVPANTSIKWTETSATKRRPGGQVGEA